MSYKKMHPTLTFLKQIRHNLKHVDYKLIYQSIADLENKLFSWGRIHKDARIARVTINRNGEIFTNAERVSYIHDKDILEKRVDFGRANEPSQAIFYGSLASNEEKNPSKVAYYETSQLKKDIHKYHNAEEIFTVSIWKVIEEFKVLEIVNNAEAMKVNGYARFGAEDLEKNYFSHPKLGNHYYEQTQFFSDEFARGDITSSSDYKISCAYANYIWKNSEYKGVTYPSVQYKYEGQNLALLPEIVNKFLVLDRLDMLKFEKRNGIILPMKPLKTAIDLGKNQMDFKWTDYVSNPSPPYSK